MSPKPEKPADAPVPDATDVKPAESEVADAQETTGEPTTESAPESAPEPPVVVTPEPEEIVPEPAPVPTPTVIVEAETPAMGDLTPEGSAYFASVKRVVPAQYIVDDEYGDTPLQSR